MRKQGEEYILTEDEIEEVRWFINDSLRSEFNDYSRDFVCKQDQEEGKKSMNPEMYTLMKLIEKLQYE